MKGRAALCLLPLALAFFACRSEPPEAAPPPAPAPAPAAAEAPAWTDPVPEMPPPVSLADAEPDAFCEVAGWQYERRKGIWAPSNMVKDSVDRVVRLGEDPELDKEIDWNAKEDMLKLGTTVRIPLRREYIEVRNDDLTDQFSGAVFQPLGKVRLPRNLGPLGTALEEQLRLDGRTGLGRIEAKFIVERDGKVGRVLQIFSLSDAYKELLIQDLRAVEFQPATLDGKPVAVVHKVDLMY